VIDDHVHPFPLEFTPLDLASMSLDVSGRPEDDARRRQLAPGRLSLEVMRSRLAGLLGCQPEEVVEARDEVAGAGWATWVNRLLADAEVEGMVMDEAVVPEDRIPPITYAEVAGRPVWEMARLEPLIDRIIGQGASAAEVMEAVDTYMGASADAGCVAFKTVIAYRTGLGVDPGADQEAAQASLEEGERAGLPVRRRGKALRDLLLRRALGRAAELGKPFQIHTGFGDSEIRLSEANPLLLEELLRTPEGQAGTVVLIHGSFPWHEEAAWLAATRPNVWVELSLSNLFAPLATAERLLAFIDLAPRDRILLGSDGHGQPETHWWGCRALLEAWPQVARRLEEAGARRPWVEETKHSVFSGNARRAYALG
jgi:hypothetical protein